MAFFRPVRDPQFRNASCATLALPSKALRMIPVTHKEHLRIGLSSPTFDTLHPLAK